MAHRASLAFVPALLVAGIAAAQPVARPTPIAGASPQPALSLPLSPEEAGRLRDLLRASIERQKTQAPRSQALREAGVPAESDPVERAIAAARGRRIGPIGIGLAVTPSAKVRADVDPALAAVTRAKLAARLDREPTPAEVDAELRVFDARVDRANRWLAANRGRVAKAYASRGSLPSTFDDDALGPGPVPSPTDAAASRRAFRDLLRSLLVQPDGGAPATPAVPANPQVPSRPGVGPIVVPTPPTPVSRPDP